MGQACGHRLGRPEYFARDLLLSGSAPEMHVRYHLILPRINPLCLPYKGFKSWATVEDVAELAATHAASSGHSTIAFAVL